MDLILTLITCLALRALSHRASSGMGKKKDFRLGAHSCNSWILALFFLLESDLQHLQSAFKQPKQGWALPECHTSVHGAYPALPKTRCSLCWCSANNNGWKTWPLGTFCSLLHTVLASPQIIWVPSESAELEGENRQIWVIWGCRDLSQSRTGAGETKESQYLPHNALGSRSVGHLGWLCLLTTI